MQDAIFENKDKNKKQKQRTSYISKNFEVSLHSPDGKKAPRILTRTYLIPAIQLFALISPVSNRLLAIEQCGNRRLLWRRGGFRRLFF